MQFFSNYSFFICVATAACATLDVFEQEKVLDNVNARSEELMGALRTLKSKYPLIKDVRGLGLMVCSVNTTRVKCAYVCACP